MLLGAILLATLLAAVPGASAQALLIGAGDIVECPKQTGKNREYRNAEATAQLLDEHARGPEAVVFTLGDNVYPKGSRKEFRECYGPTWGRHKDRTRPALGNREYNDKKSAAGYFDYFGERAGPRGKGYYSYDHGGWLIVVLNSNLCADPAARRFDPEGCARQLRWLEETLRANPRPCSLAVSHHPVVSAGEPAEDESAMRPAFRLLYEHGVEVLLAGHRHLYDRFVPLGPAAGGAALSLKRDDDRGLEQFIVGTGGKDLASIQRKDHPLRARPGAGNGAHGVLKLTLLADRYRWEFVPVAGRKFHDSGERRCH